MTEADIYQQLREIFADVFDLETVALYGDVLGRVFND